MKDIEAVVFDLDGTLIESADALRKIAARIMERLGSAPLTLEEVKRFVGSGARRFLEQALASRDLTLSPEEFERTLAAYLEDYAAAPPHDNLILPGVEAALDALAARGLPLGLCTNKPEAPTLTIIEAFGWGPRFGAVVGGDTLATRKPDPEPLLHTMRELGAARVLYVGDSEVDEETALAAGQQFAFYRGGYAKRPADTFQAALAFDDYRDLVAALAPR